MTNTNSTITPSTQILEAARKAQALADAGKALKPFLPQDSRETVEGVEKVANALKATGEAMKHFGFDEAEPEPFDAITGQKTGQKAVQADAMTGYSLNNADSGALFLFPNPDDGIRDDYLITDENANGGWMTTEPMTEIPGFLLNEAVSFEESRMDRLDSTSPFDALALNEPQKNDIF